MLSLTKVSFINMGFSPSQWALLSMFKTEVLTFRFGFQAGVSLVPGTRCTKLDPTETLSLGALLHRSIQKSASFGKEGKGSMQMVHFAQRMQETGFK